LGLVFLLAYTKDMARKLDMDITSFGTYKPVPGTLAYDKLIKLGGKVYEEKWTDSYNILIGYLVDTPFLKAHQIKKFHKGLLNEARFKYIQKNSIKPSFYYNLSKYAYRIVKMRIKPSWIPFGWVTQLDNF